jgi:hypothetical protein
MSNMSSVEERLLKLSEEISAIAAEVSSKPVVTKQPEPSKLRLPAKSGKSLSCWPATEWRNPVGYVVEVTGKRAGKHMPSMWFKPNSEGRLDALKYLRSLDQGNAWFSEAWPSLDGEVCTGKRKRINLNHPHAV